MRNALLPVLARARALKDYNGQKWKTYYWRNSRWPAGCAVGLWRVWVKEGEVVDIVAGGIHSGYVVKWKGAVDDADGELETPSAAAANDAVKLALWLRAREHSAAQHAVRQLGQAQWAAAKRARVPAPIGGYLPKPSKTSSKEAPKVSRCLSHQ